LQDAVQFPEQRRTALRHSLGLMRDRLHLVWPSMSMPIDAPLHMGCHLQDLPDITVMGGHGLGLLERLSNRLPSIASGRVPGHPCSGKNYQTSVPLSSSTGTGGTLAQTRERCISTTVRDASPGSVLPLARRSAPLC
jgi:hypothetical protein